LWEQNVLKWRRTRLSLFEKVILANVLMLLIEAAAGLWVTSHNLETHHYLIDTAFIVGATLLSLCVSWLLLRASFRPLFGLLATVRAVSAGKTDARANISSSDEQVAELARAMNTMLDRLEAARREQALLILQAQEEERRRLALELHDETGQNLTALLVHAEILNQRLQTLPDISPEARQKLEHDLHTLAKLTQHTLDDVRVLSQQLRPRILDDLGLDAALHWLAEDARQRFHLDVELVVDGAEQALPLPTIYETASFRVAQESLTNVARHAGATRATLTLNSDQHTLRLSISDDGRGFDIGQPSRGLGLLGMRERAALLGGTLTITSQQDQGTTVEVTLPLPARSLPIHRGGDGRDKSGPYATLAQEEPGYAG
jgi:two-component system, NarL family, sensor histidine kinase UhpB